MYHDNWGRGMRGDGWGGHPIFMVVALVAVIALAVWLASSVARRSHGGLGGALPPLHKSSAQDILAERLARGEIEVDDYHHRLEALRKPEPPRA